MGACKRCFLNASEMKLLDTFNIGFNVKCSEFKLSEEIGKHGLYSGIAHDFRSAHSSMVDHTTSIKTPTGTIR